MRITSGNGLAKHGFCLILPGLTVMLELHHFAVFSTHHMLNEEVMGGGADGTDHPGAQTYQEK